MRISVYSCTQQSIGYNGKVENTRERDSRMSTVNHFKEEIMFFKKKSERTAKINWILISKHFCWLFHESSHIHSTHAYIRCHDPTNEHRKLMAQPYFHLVYVKRRPFAMLVQNITTNTKYYLIVCILSLSLSLSFFLYEPIARARASVWMRMMCICTKYCEWTREVNERRMKKAKECMRKILQHKQKKRHEPPRSASHILFSI